MRVLTATMLQDDCGQQSKTSYFQRFALSSALLMLPPFWGISELISGTLDVDIQDFLLNSAAIAVIEDPTTTPSTSGISFEE